MTIVNLGTAIGKLEKIGGVQVYVAIPTKEYAKDKALLYLPGEVTSRSGSLANVATDAFGLHLSNAQVS